MLVVSMNSRKHVLDSSNQSECAVAIDFGALA